jgi:hypothetical protein
MKKGGFRLALATFCTLVCWTGSTAIAQNKATSKKAGKSDAKESAARAEELGPRAAIRIQNTQRLRQMIDEKIKLSPQQASAINRIFDDYVDDVKESYKGRKKPSDPDYENKVLPPTTGQLEKRKRAADASGDKAKLDAANEEMSNRRREPLVPGENYSNLLTEKVRLELKPDQVPVFDKVVERWNLIVPKGPRTGPFQRLRRALKDPEVGLSAEVQKAADERLQAALTATRRGSETSEEKMEEEISKAQAEIFTKLTPEQRKKVEANLRAFKEVERQYDDSKARAKESGVLKRKGGKASAKQAPLDPAVEKPADAKPAAVKPAEEKPAETKP